MTEKAADLSVARPGGAVLRAHGYFNVIRYAAINRNDGVNITKPEADDYKANGIRIGIVNEYNADYMLHANGAACANGAKEVTEAAGLPDGPVFFAADFDATNNGPTFPGSPGDHNITVICNFLDQAAAAIGENNVGFYGSYFACLAVLRKLPWLKLYWQTEAWSHGLFFWEASIYQYANIPSGIPGVDRDSTVNGYWGYRVFAPEKLSSQVLALPLLRLGATGNAVAILQKGMNLGSNAGLTVDGVFGKNTMNAVDNTQKLWHLTVDGVAGPQTDKVIAYEDSLKGN